MSKVAFTGGSITSGVGWNLPAEKDLMWVNLVHKNCFSEFDLINAGNDSTTNADIFKESIRLIAENTDLSVLICSWVTILRHKFSLGFELYNTTTLVNVNKAGDPALDVELNTGTIPKKYLADLKNRFLTLHHFHYEIQKILDYVNVINKLCKQHNIQVYHVNDSCPWDSDYFTRLQDVTPEQYTNFTKTEILNIQNRNDEEIYKLYKKMHDEYDNVGGAQECSWINLYNSWQDTITDTNHDGYHPGQQSNYNYYTVVKNFLKTQ